jgi:plastocyanin
MHPASIKSRMRSAYMKTGICIVRSWAILAVIFSLLIIATAGCTGGKSPKGTQNTPPTSIQTPQNAPPTTTPPMAQTPTTATPPVSTTSVTVIMKDNTYSPREIRITPGGTITWTNADKATHSIIADVKNLTPNGPDTEQAMPDGIAPGMSWTWKVPDTAPAGTMFYYHCKSHGQPGDGKSMGTGMSGLIVIEAPAGTTTGGPGTAPAGNTSSGGTSTPSGGAPSGGR